MTEQQIKRLNELESYAREIRSNTDDKQQKEICTNVLAWIILIRDSQ